MTVRYVVGDVFEVLASMKPASVDLAISSPPFLCLRSYLPADHPLKAKEIGSEATPADFLDTLLDVTEAIARVLAPHGSICIELGDTYAGSGGAGGDYNPDTGLRAGQPAYKGSNARKENRVVLADGRSIQSAGIGNGLPRAGNGWPQDKSLCGIPTLYAWSLAYGRNLLRPERTTPPWRIRNLRPWVRNNPPVGALGDKVRPATSYMVVATKARDRWFDLDAVRKPASPNTHPRTAKGIDSLERSGKSADRGGNWGSLPELHETAGAPPLDWVLCNPKGYSGQTSTTRRVPCGPGDGGRRTTSPDCPLHGDRAAPPPTALCGEREGSESNHTSRSDSRHALEQPRDGVSNGVILDPPGSSPAPMTAMTLPECSPSATPHNTASSRTDLAPATTFPDTASEGSPGRTGDTSASPLFDVPNLGTPASSTAAACPPVDEPETPSHIADTPSPESACTCSWYRVVTESTSHYAVWPEELLHEPIESMCPRRVCRACGMPSRRIAETTNALGARPVGAATGKGAERNRLADTEAVRHWDMNGAPDIAERLTTGWTTCGCPGADGLRLDGFHTGAGWRPGVVLDPFGGSGTSGVVAVARSRDAVLIDLDERNAELAYGRLGWMLDVEHHAEAEPA